jgi:nucleoid-associated protein YgaU
VLLTISAGCAPTVSRWRDEARLQVEQVRGRGAERFFSTEMRDLEFTFRQGDLLMAESRVEQADGYYLLALTKGRLIEQSLVTERERQEEAARQRAEAARREETRQRELAERAEQELRRVKEREASIARMRAEAELAAQAEARRKQERARQLREKPLPTHHTVKRGETLPQIAAQADVYNDASLWPLIYRANRDQIRDPRVIWPGQVLRIPRNYSRDDLSEARRYSQERPLR